MLDKTYEILLDTEKELYMNYSPLFSVNRNDYETVDFLFTIMQDDKPLDLTGCNVELAIKKPSGLTVYQACNIADATAGKATAKLSIQGYVEYGIHTGEVYVRTGNQLAVTCAFFYTSKEAVMQSEEVDSINDWTALQQALFAYTKKPLLVSGFPTDTPEYVGQFAFDIVNKLTYIAADVTAGSWQAISGGGEGGGAVDTIISTGAPTTAPVRIGQVYIDTAPAPHGIYMAAGATAADWIRLDNDGLSVLIAWEDITGKPNSFTPNLSDPGLSSALNAKADKTQLTGYAPVNHTHTVANITDFAQGVAANIPADLLTEAEGDARYLTDVPAEYQTTAQADAKYLTAIPDEYLTQAEGDARYLAQGSDPGTVAASWGTITGTLADQTDLQNALNAKADDTDLAGYAPVNHTHTIANVTGLQGALDAKADDSDLAGYAPVNHVHTIAQVTGLQGALDAKADDTDLANYAPLAHTQDISTVNGLQAALDNKANLVDLEGHPTYDDVYLKADVYNKTEIDQMTLSGGGSTVIVEDNLASTSTTNALSANQGRILNTTKASLNHTHTVSQITDFSTGVANNIPATYQTTAQADAKYLTAIPAEYLTQSEADGLYQPAGTYLTSIPAEYVTDSEANATYAPISHTHTVANITDFAAGVSANIPAEYLTSTEGDAAYAAKSHTHTASQITDFSSAVAANIPATYETTSHASATYETQTHASATYETQTHAAATYQPKGTYLTTVPLMSGSAIGGAQVGNGLGMSGNYLLVKTGAGLGIAGDNSVQVQTTNTTPAPVRFWTGSQTDYSAIASPDPNTLYFITG